MSITATCGHDVSEEKEQGIMIALAEHSRSGSRAVGHPVVCEKCFEDYNKKGLILTKPEQKDWLYSGNLPQRIKDYRKQFEDQGVNPDECDATAAP